MMFKKGLVVWISLDIPINFRHFHSKFRDLPEINIRLGWSFFNFSFFCTFFGLGILNCKQLFFQGYFLLFNTRSSFTFFNTLWFTFGFTYSCFRLLTFSRGRCFFNQIRHDCLGLLSTCCNNCFTNNVTFLDGTIISHHFDN